MFPALIPRPCATPALPRWPIKTCSSGLRMKLTGHKTEGEHRKYTHHEMDNLAAPRQKKSRPLADFNSGCRTLSNIVDIADSVIHIGLTMKQQPSEICETAFPALPRGLMKASRWKSQNPASRLPVLCPPRRKKPRRFKMPDIKARLERTFGYSTYDAADMARGLAASRGVLS